MILYIAGTDDLNIEKKTLGEYKKISKEYNRLLSFFEKNAVQKIFDELFEKEFKKINYENK